MPRKQISRAAIVILGTIGMVSGQQPAQPLQPQPVQPQTKILERRGPDPAAPPLKGSETAAKAGPAKDAPADYILGADDQITLWTPESDELNNKVVRISGDGAIALPLIGSLKAAGLTPNQLAAEISTKLKKYYVTPQVVVSVQEYRSQPVSVIGAVNTPGVHQVQGRKTLVELLSMAGGPRQDAGPAVIVTRQAEFGPIPVDGATMDSSGKFSTAEIDLKAVTMSERPQDNIAIKPNDIISVPKAHLVYVVGEVERAGGFILGEREGVSVIQALTMAGGLKSTASAKNARIIRNDQSGPKEGTPVDLKAMLSGKERDIRLQPDDILYIPDSRPRRAGIRVAEAAIQMATGVAIWRASGNR